MSMRRSKGFTLIELLVALSITAIIMVIAYGGLGALSKQADHSRDSLKRLRQVQLAMEDDPSASFFIGGSPQSAEPGLVEQARASAAKFQERRQAAARAAAQALQALK